MVSGFHGFGFGRDGWNPGLTVSTGKTSRTFAAVILSGGGVDALPPILANPRVFLAKGGHVTRGWGQIEVAEVAAPARVASAFVGVVAVAVLATRFRFALVTQMTLVTLAASRTGVWFGTVTVTTGEANR